MYVDHLLKLYFSSNLYLYCFAIGGLACYPGAREKVSFKLVLLSSHVTVGAWKLHNIISMIFPTKSVNSVIYLMHRIGELEDQLVKRSEAAVLLEEQKKEQEEKIRQLEASKAQVEQALQAQQKVTISAMHIRRSIY